MAIKCYSFLRLCCRLMIFFKNANRVLNGLDPYHDRRSVGRDMGLKRLQRLSENR